MDVMELAAAERADLADLLATLTPEQWAARSLCTAWSVREVAMHTVSYDELSWLALPGRFVQGRFDPGRVNDVCLQPYAGLGPDEVVAFIRAHLRPRGLTAAMGGRIALTDGLIHHQDVRRALGLPRVVPPERVRAALDVAMTAPTIPGRRNVRGLRLVSTDLDWTHGKGPEVTGPAEAILMAAAGRPDPLPELSGPGAATLAARVSGAAGRP